MVLWKPDIAFARLLIPAVLDHGGAGNDHPWQASVLSTLADQLRRVGKRERARVCIEEALKLRIALGDRMGIARSHHHLGIVRCELGNYEAARESLEAALGEALGGPLGESPGRGPQGGPWGVPRRFLD